jgi:hypothetical protein
VSQETSPTEPEEATEADEAFRDKLKSISFGCVGWQRPAQLKGAFRDLLDKQKKQT